MRLFQTPTLKWNLYFLVISILFSCSKDADLLSDYVTTNNTNIDGVFSMVVDDSYYVYNNGSLILDVLNNDNFKNLGNVTVVGTTNPSHGTVVINENNTLTYVPENVTSEENETTDTFDYTTEETSEEGIVNVDTGNVTVNNNKNFDHLSPKIQEWKSKFDTEWDRSKDYYLNQSTGTEVEKQRRYYDFRVIDGLIYMFQATGDTKYVTNFFWYLDRLKSIAVKSNDDYYDWPVAGENYQLYDGHGLRNIFKMFWLLKKYPEISVASNFQEKYNTHLPWFTKNLWDKWKARGANTILRGNTHMASHMASNMALYLSLLEDNATKKNEYLTWVKAWNNNIHSKWPNYSGVNPSGFRNQLRLNDPHSGYVWAARWGNQDGANDITHTNAEVQAVINQYHQGIEWNDNDLQLFLNTLNNILDQAQKLDFSDIPFYIDLTDQLSVKTLAYGWVMLGRFDETTQTRLKNFSITRNKASYYYNVYLGVMAFNRAYLDNTVIYSDF